jgi:hypothetical protein
VASRALVVGVGAYDDDSGIQSYAAIAESARLYGELLASDPRFGPEGCRVLGPQEVRTSDGVMRALQEASAAGRGADDVLLVVYVGHGAYWHDVPGGQVHFAVGASRHNEPWTWLSSWYVYRAIRQSRAGFKVLISDCCYSNLLPHLGPDSGRPPGTLGTRHRGTCVLTAVREGVSQAGAEACPALPEPYSACTPFSGHLLKVLHVGIADQPEDLTLGAVRAGVVKEMADCDARHPGSGMLLNDASEAVPLFTNRAPGLRGGLRRPRSVDEWAGELQRTGLQRLEELLEEPALAGRVVARLRRDDRTHDLALRVNHEATARLVDPTAFIRYWGEAEPLMLENG